VLVNTSFTEVPTSYRSSLSFIVANILGAPTLDLHEGTTYNVVHLPLYLPIPFVINDTTKGTITEASMDILNTNIKNGAFWTLCILEHDATCSDEPIRCTTNPWQDHESLHFVPPPCRPILGLTLELQGCHGWQQ
jgi:hypothetical protein